MSKILKLVILTFVIIGSTAYGKEKSLYVKGWAGAHKLNAFNIESYVLPIQENVSRKMKTKHLPFWGVGIGYYINDKVRIDLSYEGFATHNSENEKHKILAPNPGMPTYVSGRVVRTTQVKTTHSMSSLMSNLYLDIHEQGPTKVFWGAGVGVSHLRLKHDIILHAKVEDMSFVQGRPILRDLTQGLGALGINTANNNNAITGSLYSAPMRTKYSFAYALYFGTATKLTPNVNLDITYSWKHLGKIDAIAFKSHNVSLGLRLDI